MAENADSTREKILETSVNLFAHKGFKGTSIRDIAGAMGMSISNIYHYFGSKEGLLIAILDQAAKQVEQDLLAAAQSGTDPQDRMRRLIMAHVVTSGSSPNAAKVFSLDEEHLTDEGRNINRQNQWAILNLYLRELDHMARAGLIQPRNHKVLAFNILGVINWVIRWYRPEGPMSIEEVAEEIVVFCMNGLFGNGLPKGL